MAVMILSCWASWSQAAPPGFAAPETQLWVLAVGINAYRDSALHLKYAKEDAEAVAAIFTTQRGGLYAQVHVRVLKDADATKERILDGLQWLADSATHHDRTVLFLGGHGTTDARSGQYYFLPWDADGSAVWRSMLPASDLRTALKSIPGDVLLLLDTCYAAAALDDRRGSDSARGAGRTPPSLQAELLPARARAVVLAAGNEWQPSIEAKNLRHGAFTAALLEGLRSEAATDSRGRISWMGLDAFLARRVKALSGGHQTPTLWRSESTPDFPLFQRARFGAHDVDLY